MIHGGEIYDKTIEYDFSVNLNPLPCPKEVMKALLESAMEVTKYPDIDQSEFREAVAEAENKLAKDFFLTRDNIIGGNGASELIMAIIRLISPKNVLIPVPSFSGYRHGLNALDDVKVAEYLLREDNDFELTDDFVSHITYDTNLVIIANPNNPTGRLIDRSVLSHIIERCKKTGTWIIIDECFLHLTDGAESAVKYVRDVPRLFIVNAYTKLFSLPGIRIGYAISGDENIRVLKRFLPEWNMSVIAQKSGTACAKQICETDFVSATQKEVNSLRSKLTTLLSDLGYHVFISDSCFVLIKAGEDLYKLLLDERILIRDCLNFQGLEDGYYRISVSGYDRLNEIREI